MSLHLDNASLLESVDSMLEDFPAQQLPREMFNAFVLGVSPTDFVNVFQLIPPSDNLDRIVS